MHLDRDDVTVGPGESVEVPFAVTLPKDAAPGDYMGGIVTSAAEGDEASIQIRLRVGGALKPSLAVENVHVDYSGTSNPIGKGDATVTYTIHNTGNAILTRTAGGVRLRSLRALGRRCGEARRLAPVAAG